MADDARSYGSAQRSYGSASLNTITKTQAAEVEALFNLVDTDGSGLIDEGELEELFELVGVDASPEEIRQVMLEADADGSGEIDREEWADVMLAPVPCDSTPSEVLRCFRLLAGPHPPRNGRMDHACLVRALTTLGRDKCDAAGARALAEQLNPRKDGTVAYARFVANTLRHSGAAAAAAGEAGAAPAAPPRRRAPPPPRSRSPAARRPPGARPNTAPALGGRRSAREVRDMAALDRLRRAPDGAALVPQYGSPASKLPG